MVREVSYREFQKHHGSDPEPLAISYRAYKVGSFIKCPLRWTQGAIEAIHEEAESYMISLLEDANYSCQEDYCAAPGYPAGMTSQGGAQLELFGIWLKWLFLNWWGKSFFFCEHSVNCELLYITGVGDEGVTFK